MKRKKFEKAKREQMLFIIAGAPELAGDRIAILTTFLFILHHMRQLQKSILRGTEGRGRATDHEILQDREIQWLGP